MRIKFSMMQISFNASSINTLLTRRHRYDRDVAKWAASAILQINQSRLTCRNHIHAVNIMGIRAVFFTGTCGIKEWIDGIDLFDGIDGAGHYHPGWKKLYDNERLAALLASEDVGPGGLWLFGYSLGGALATIHAAELVRGGRGNIINGLYTFGSPRTCDRETARLLENSVSNIYRVANAYDPVVRVPPEFMGYRHVGTNVSVSFVDPLCNHTLFNYCKHV